MYRDAIERAVRKYARRVGLARDYSAHTMRAAFITTTLQNGAMVEDVQDAAGHTNPSTTRFYDQRGFVGGRVMKTARTEWSESTSEAGS